MRGPDSAIPPRGIGVWPSRQPQVGRGPRLVFCIDYRYDLCGNRVLRMHQPAEDGRESATTYYDTNELNQLTRAVEVERDEFLETYLIATTYFSYDMNGNTVARLTTDEEGLLTGATYYDWDAESQLVGVRSLAGLDNAFAYDGRYQRVEKQQAAGTVRYNWDGLNVLLERDGDDEPLATHTHGPVPIAGIGTHLTTRKHGETPEDLWYHHDAIGSTRQLSDETQPPALTRQNLLDAWGNLLATAGTQDTPYRFTGKETDEDTGLIYFGRRFFDPAMGRWLNRDPARDGQNWYEYAASNPMARVDAEGLQNIDPYVPDDLVVGGYERLLRSRHGGVPARRQYLEYQLRYLANMGGPGQLPDPLAPLSPDEEQIAALALRVGRAFHLEHPWAVAAVWRYESSWRERPGVGYIAGVQDARASRSPSSTGTIGPLQLNVETMASIERRLHDAANRAPHEVTSLLPRVTGGTTAEQLGVRTQRALSLEWSLRYLAAWLWLFERQIPAHNAKYPRDRWQVADFVPEYWNKNPGAGLKGAVLNPTARHHYKQLWWLSVGELGLQFMRMERSLGQ